MTQQLALDRRSFSARGLTPLAAITVAAVITLMIALSATPAVAHVALDQPNGGEMIAAGSVLSIVWHDVISHGPANYDLWYSTSGPDGPWVLISLDLTPADGPQGYTYAWAVPDLESDQVRVRVRQDNTSGADYEDISDANLTIQKTAANAVVELTPVRDATLYEGNGSLANGSGSYLFTGRTENQNGAVERRAMVAFDLAGEIPEGSTVTAVSLTMRMSRTTAGAETVGLHRVLESWGEGASVAAGQEGGGAAAATGDATWVHRMYPDTTWSSVGGSFAAQASASQQIGGVGDYTFSSTASLVGDVQAWLDSPSSNHGWALVMPSPGVGSAKRFNSRNHGTAVTRPTLTITFEASAELPAAAFAFSPESPQAGAAVSFTDQSTGAPTSWLWDFGDGDSATEQHPSHSYAVTGTYTVSLSVSNSSGSDSTSQMVTVVPATEPELSELVLVPAAANAAGSGGSFFVTTVDVHNAGAAAAWFRFLWLPRSTNNSSPEQSELLMLEPGASMRFANILADVFGKVDVIGAVAVLSDSVDLAVMSRTFNQTDTGTFGQSLPGVSSRNLIPAGTRVRVLFLTENDGFRSNLGLVNGVDLPITVQWELFAADGSSLRTGQTALSPWSNRQLNSVLEDFAPIEAAYADVWTDTTGGAFTCYGSVLDLLSSDPTTVLPLLL